MTARARARRLFADPGDTQGSIAAQALVVLGTALFLAIQGPQISESWTYFFGVLVAVAAAVLLFANYRLALIFFVMFLFSYEEFELTSKEAFLADTPDKIVLYIRIFGVTLMDFISVILLVPVLIREWLHAMRTGRIRILPFDVLLLPLLAVFAFGAVTGAFNSETISTYTWDLRSVGHILVFYFIFSRTFSTRQDAILLLVAAGAVFLLKNSIFISRYLSGEGLVIGQEYRRILLGSDLTFTTVSLTLTISAFLLFPRIRLIWRIVLLGVSVYFTVMLLSGLGRLTYILASIALFMVFYLNRERIRAVAVVFVLGIGVTGAVLFYNTALSEENRRVISYALSSAFDWVEALREYSDLSIGTRVLEVINIWANLKQEDAVLWGLGWGSAYREIAVLHPLDGGAGPFEEQLAGVHVHAHTDFAEFLLKLGVAGTLVLYWTFFRVWRRGVRLYRRQETQGRRFALLALLVMLIIIAPNFIFFIRLHIVLGIVLACLAMFDAAPASDG